jgi:aromatic ring hydroxylase
MSIIAFSQVKNLKNGMEKEEVLALKTANEYLDTIKKMKPHVYIGGKWVKNLLDHPVTRSMVMANAAIYGQRETSTMVFDDIFIPWERVFLFGETKYCGRLVSRFAKTHRMNCAGAPPGQRPPQKGSK